MRGSSVRTYVYRLRKLVKRLKLWVDIKELNEEGEYVSVAFGTKPGVTTGGMFRIQQGQSRKIQVTVNALPVSSGKGSLLTDCISSVSISSISVVKSDQPQPNSFDTYDLER